MYSHMRFSCFDIEIYSHTKLKKKTKFVNVDFLGSITFIFKKIFIKIGMLTRQNVYINTICKSLVNTYRAKK